MAEADIDRKVTPDSELRERLHRVIPGGAHTYSRGDDQYPSNAPAVLERGEGAYVWDTGGRRFLDYGMALRAVTIGYADPRVNAAAIAQIEKGVNLTRPSTIELRAAEYICDTIPTAEMVKFGKNGSNVTTAAVKVARAYTGRRYVCIPRQHPFFSFDDWFIGTTAVTRGVAPEHTSSTLVFDYNDIASLERLFAEHPGEIAAVMMEPATHITPAFDAGGGTFGEGFTSAPRREPSFLHRVRALTEKHGALLIFDEMITGFRWHLEGAQSYFGVSPDITTFGKAMANGFALAALVGRREVMNVAAINTPGTERTFLMSTTHGGEMPALGAFIEATRIAREERVTEHLWHYGSRFREGWNALASKHGVADHLFLQGPAIALHFVTCDRSLAPCMKLRTLLLQEMVRRGVLMPCITFAQAHGELELEMTMEALDGAFEVCARALTDGVEAYLEGPAVKPVFRKFN